MHAAIRIQVSEELKDPVFCNIFVEVGARRDEHNVARRAVASPISIEDPEETQATWIHHLLRVAPVAARWEGSAARVERVVDVAEYLDPDRRATALMPHGLRLPREVLQDLLPNV